jgi:hypothetical protein
LGNSERTLKRPVFFHTDAEVSFLFSPSPICTLFKIDVGESVEFTLDAVVLVFTSLVDRFVYVKALFDEAVMVNCT